MRGGDIALRAAALALVVAACGGPLDRRDGRLRIELQNVPASANAVSVRVRAGGRTFQDRLSRPERDVIETFTAVPAGPAAIDVVVYRDQNALASKQDVPVDIVENEERTVQIRMASGPEVEVVRPEEGARHRYGSGPITVEVRPLATGLPTDLSISVMGVGEPLPVAVTGAEGGWTSSIDESIVRQPLPDEVEIVVRACAAADPGVCTEIVRSVIVERRVWSASFPVVRARPAYVGGADSAIAFGDREGKLHVYTLATGEPRFPAISGVATTTRAVAIADDLMIAVNARGVVTAVDLHNGVFAWENDLGTSLAGTPIYDERGQRIIITAGERLLALAHLNLGVATQLSSFPAPIRATPYVDELGVIAADTSGVVRVFDVDGDVVAEGDVGASVVVTPIREGLFATVVDVQGRLHRVPPIGEVIVLSPPPIHAPVRAGEAIAIAFGRRIAWVRGGLVTETDAGGPITGAPTPWPEGQAVLLASDQPGLVKIVREDGTAQAISRTEGKPLAPLLTLEPRRVVVPETTGTIEVFELGEDF